MWIRRPTDSEIARRLAAREVGFSHREVGATRSREAPRGYRHDVREFAIGQGRPVFERACDALFAWRHFDVPWLELLGGDRPAEPGQVVATLTRVVGLWFLNPCRVVYVEPLSAGAAEAAFAYGTLPGHAVSGEERFSVRLDSETGLVTYRLEAFSRPARIAPRLGGPLLRRIQRRFAESSAEALRAASRGNAAQGVVAVGPRDPLHRGAPATGSGRE